MAADDGSVVDVLVVYTPAVRAAAGGTAAINAHIDNAAAVTNTAYADSGVNQRIRVVYRAETAYAESGSGTALGALRGSGDGQMDEVHALRNTYGADLVALMGVFSDACGVAYLMTSVSATFASSAFSVTAWDCAVGNRSFAHELGHNMGLHHDPANAGGQGAYSYAYGYQDPDNFRTVMAYACAGGTCPRVGRFSNPNSTYNGRVTGTANQNNVLALNNTAFWVANFRQAIDPGPGCTYTAGPSTISVGPDAGTHEVNVTTAAGCAWTASSNAAWITPAAPDGTGAGTQAFAVTANAGGPRSGTVTVAGQIVTIKQAASGTPAWTYYLAEGASSTFFTLDLAIGNPNGDGVSASVAFLKSDGSTIVRTYSLLATSRTTINVNAIPGLETAEASTVVTSPSGLPLMVERTMQWDATGYGGHTEAAVNGPSTRWYFAEGSQGFFDTYVLLANPGGSSATVTLQFLTELDGVVQDTVTVSPTSRRTIEAKLYPLLAGKSFSIVVESNAPIVAERAMYFGAPPFWNGGHESAGAPAPSTTWLLAEGATGSFFDTYILVGNPNASQVTATFTYLLPSGVTVVKNKTVPANGRLTVLVDVDDPLLANTAVSTQVTATLPLVVERSMYWAGPSTAWYEGHNSFGVTSAGTKWGLGEGRVGSSRGYETYILIANTNAAPARVQVTFLRTNGTVVIKNHTVAATSRFNVPFPSELANEEFSAVIQSTNGVPIVVERAMYWNARGVTWAAGTNATATPLP